MSIERMVSCVERVAAGRPSCARTTTAIPRLAIWRSIGPTRPEPAMFDPKFYMLLQGRKRMTIGGQHLDYAAGRYAVSSVGIPFMTRVTEASPEAPYLGVELALDAGLVASLLLDMPDTGAREAPAIDTAQAADDVTEPLERLLRLLSSPADIPVLAPLFERELYYRLLGGPVGGTLRQVVRSHARFAQVRAAIEWIGGNASEPMSVAKLAKAVGMSATSFHRHFKAVTAHSPLAYQRHVRLLGARELLVSGEANVTAIAFAVGYASASQFSREYKRMFGVSPIHDAGLARRRPDDARHPVRRTEAARRPSTGRQLPERVGPDAYAGPT